MTKMIFVNLPVKDLAASIRFYEALGCTQNHQFSDEKSASMVWSDTIFFMLLTHDRFADFAPRRIADAHEACGHLVALSFDSREAVDKVTEAAGASGGKADVRPPMDMGFMYGRSFEDPDGNVFEPIWMDMAAASQGQA
ncbi:VOC family protein [Roseibium sp. M-1]